MTSISKLARSWTLLVAIGALVMAMGGNWMTPATATAAPVTTHTTQRPAQRDAPDDDTRPKKKPNVAGKLNLNTANEVQLMMLPSVGPSKAERIVAWRRKNGGFKRIADLRRVKGFGYKTFKRLEPLLDVAGETTLAAK